MRVAIVQLESNNNPEKAIENAIEQINKACVAEAEIICLPEKWYPAYVTNLEEELSLLIKTSKDRDVCIIGGAFIEKIDDKWYISSPVIEDGRIIDRQFKMHHYAKEQQIVSAGNKLNVFDYKHIKFGIAICHDIVFPEISRILTLKGSDIIFYPSKIHSEAIEPWHIYTQARALENRIIALAPNICGDIFGGRSIIVDISYIDALDTAKTYVVEASVSNQQILVGDFDIERIRRIRRIRLDELRSDYSSL